MSSLAVRKGVLGAFLAVVLGVLLTDGTAWATNAVIADPRVEGPILPADQAKLSAVLEQALREQHFDLIPAADVASVLSGEPNLNGCHSELCLERLGRLLDGQIVLRYRVKRTVPAGAENGDWHVNAEVLDVEVGAMGASLTADCADCTGEQAANQLLDIVRRAILHNAARPRGGLLVQSQPPGAVVLVDGTELGATPFKRTAFTGPHKLVLRHVGYHSEQIDVVVEETQHRRIKVKLTPGSDPMPGGGVDKDKTPMYRKGWFWVAVGGAAVAVGVITVGVVLGTRGSDRTPPANTLIFNF